jgi:hypothetical protein
MAEDNSTTPAPDLKPQEEWAVLNACAAALIAQNRPSGCSACLRYGDPDAISDRRRSRSLHGLMVQYRHCV